MSSVSPHCNSNRDRDSDSDSDSDSDKSSAIFSTSPTSDLCRAPTGCGPITKASTTGGSDRLTRGSSAPRVTAILPSTSAPLVSDVCYTSVANAPRRKFVCLDAVVLRNLDFNSPDGSVRAGPSVVEPTTQTHSAEQSEVSHRAEECQDTEEKLESQMCRETVDSNLLQAPRRRPPSLARARWRKGGNEDPEDRTSQEERRTKLELLNTQCRLFEELDRKKCRRKNVEESIADETGLQLATSNLSPEENATLDSAMTQIGRFAHDLYQTEMNKTRKIARDLASQLGITARTDTTKLDQVIYTHYTRSHMVHASEQIATLKKNQNLTAPSASHVGSPDPTAEEQQRTDEDLLRIDKSLREGANIAIVPSQISLGVPTDWLLVQTPNPFFSTKSKREDQVKGRLSAGSEKMTAEPCLTTTRGISKVQPAEPVG